MRNATWAVWLLAIASLACAAAPARAQFADSTAASEFFETPLASPRFSLFGDVRLRDELADHVPNRADRLHRDRATLRGGARWTPSSLWAVELSGRASLGSDRNDEFFPTIDNEAPDTIEVDRANVRLGSESGLSLRAGRIVMPLRLSEMLWDRDLRPWGTAATGRWAIGALDVARAGIAVVHRNDAQIEPSLVAVQAGWFLREGASRSGEIIASALVFRNEDLTLASRLTRQNRVGTDGAVEDMTVGSLHVEGHIAVAGVPLLASADGVDNFRADTDRLGVRTRLRVGSSREHVIEAGWAYQRVQQQALPGAYGSDDWWFKTRMQGNLVWIDIAPLEWLSLHVHATDEHRDDRSDHLRRLVTELTVRIPER